MKITGIDIGEYRQFKNIKFDFTYPDDYRIVEKRGQPLEKICFIGQSGTGKTTLLNVIWDFFTIVDDGYQLYTRQQLIRPATLTPYRTFEKLTVSACTGGKSVSFGEHDLINYKESLFRDLSTISSSTEWIKVVGIINEIKEAKKLCLYLDESAINHAFALTDNRNESEYGNKPYVTNDNELFLANEKKEEFITKISVSKITALGHTDNRYLWNYLLNDVDKYEESLRKIAMDLIQKNNSFSPNRLSENLSKWQKENPNPKIDIAINCLNPILKKLHLEVDVEGTEASIVLKVRNGVQLFFNTLSTGTKQLLTTAISIYKSQINNGVILFDEPERSLFPDIQRELVKYYTGLAPEAQFFFATHSPIIAAAFEPEERFILYFDEDGEVKYRKGVAPIGDDPNDILRKDFWMSPLMHEEGLAAYKKYLDLATQIRNETDEDKKNQLLVERLELGNLYNFAGQHAPH